MSMYHLLCGSGSPKRHLLRLHHRMNVTLGRRLRYGIQTVYVAMHVIELWWGYCLYESHHNVILFQ